MGTIRFLGAGRSRPYAVHPPATERDSKGEYIRPPALCYVSSWYVGLSVLTAYKAGTYKPGDEIKIESEFSALTSESGLTDFARRVLKNCAVASGRDLPSVTFAGVYKDFYEWKYGSNAPKALAENTQIATKTAFRVLAPIHSMPMSKITLKTLQDTVNQVSDGTSYGALCVSLIKQVYKYAVPRDLCQKDLGQYVVAPRHQAAEKKALSDADLSILWAHQGDPIVDAILIMCYSGFRISAYPTLEINLSEKYFRGGIKTASGRDRIVPIHSAILPLVERHPVLYTCSQTHFRDLIAAKLSELGLDAYTPHCFRHTFSRLCESYGVREPDRKRMMGHSLGSDLTNSIYGHRSLEELRTEIEKIIVTISDH